MNPTYDRGGVFQYLFHLAQCNDQPAGSTAEVPGHGQFRDHGQVDGDMIHSLCAATTWGGVRKPRTSSNMPAEA